MVPVDLAVLEVGNVGLSDIESRSHFALWCMFASPLLVGTDLRVASNATMATLTAAEVIAVNQDALGLQGRRVASSTAATGTDYAHKASFNGSDVVAPGVRDVYVKQLVGGKAAALLLNRDDTASVDITLSFADVPGLTASSKVMVRDLFAKSDVGVFTGSYTASSVAPHDQVTLGLTPM